MVRRVLVVLAVAALLLQVPSRVVAGGPGTLAAGKADAGRSQPVAPATATTADPVHPTFEQGDVFVGANDGKVEWRLPDGTLNMILDTGAAGSETTGMAFDEQGNLYVTAFQDNNVYRFNNQGMLLGTWGYAYNQDPESIVFDADGYSYIGQADGSRDVLKFDLLGDISADFDPATEDRGTDWIDLASDQCTMRYTSEGQHIKQFDVCTSTQLPDWATLPSTGTAYALRLLGDDQALVADWNDIRWIRSDGSLVRTFDVPGEDAWFALNLDPDGNSFWSADYYTGQIFHFDLATGEILGTFTSTTGRASGLAVFGEFHAGTVRSCESEDLSGTYGEIDPTAPGDRVTVVYDSRFLSQNGEAQTASAMASKVKERAERALDYYGTDGIDGNPALALGLPTPDALRIEIKCRPSFFIGDVGRPGFSGVPGVVQLRVETIRDQLA